MTVVPSLESATTNSPPAPAVNSSLASTAQCHSRVLLQTARTVASSGHFSEAVPVRILMDGGSETSYVTTSLKEKLQLCTIKTEVLNLNTFGNEQHSKKRCELVRVRLRSCDGEDIEICALTFPAICAPPVSFIDMSHFTVLRELNLADDPQRDEYASDTIDILIGSDHYWDIVIGDITREGDGPVSIE